MNDPNRVDLWLLGQIGATGAGLGRVYGATATPGAWVNDAGGFNAIAPGTPIEIPGSALVPGALVELLALVEVDRPAYPGPSVSVDLGVTIGGVLYLVGTASIAVLAGASSATVRGETLVRAVASGTAGAGGGLLGPPNQTAQPFYASGEVVGSIYDGDPATLTARFSLGAADATVRGRVAYARATVTPPGAS